MPGQMTRAHKQNGGSNEMQEGGVPLRSSQGKVPGTNLADRQPATTLQSQICDETCDLLSALEVWR